MLPPDDAAADNSPKSDVRAAAGPDAGGVLTLGEDANSSFRLTAGTGAAAGALGTPNGNADDANGASPAIDPNVGAVELRAESDGSEAGAFMGSVETPKPVNAAGADAGSPKPPKAGARPLGRELDEVGTDTVALASAGRPPETAGVTSAGAGVAPKPKPPNPKAAGAGELVGAAGAGAVPKPKPPNEVCTALATAGVCADTAADDEAIAGVSAAPKPPNVTAAGAGELATMPTPPNEVCAALATADA